MALSKVTANGITDNAVTTAKIATGAVEESDLAANAVTSAKITDGTVAAADLASSLDLSGKKVDESKIKNQIIIYLYSDGSKEKKFIN